VNVADDPSSASLSVSGVGGPSVPGVGGGVGELEPVAEGLGFGFLVLVGDGDAVVGPGRAAGDDAAGLVAGVRVGDGDGDGLEPATGAKATARTAE